MSSIANENGRFNANGHANTTPAKRKPGKSPGKTAKNPRKRTNQRKAKRNDHLRLWAASYVAVAAVMSCGLNALANGLHAPPAHQWAAWAMGAAIPVLVLLMGRVAGLLYHRGHIRGAAALATVGCVVLGLSVFHCEQSIALLTGSNHVLAAMLAVGIDCGLVGCEAAAMLDE